MKINGRGGCFGGCLAVGIMAAVIVIGVGIAALVLGVIQNSDVYEQAVLEASTDARVNSVLGEPVEVGWWVTGSLETSPNSGSADLVIPLNGAREVGRLHELAFKRGDSWQFTLLEVRVDGETIPLLGE